MELLNTISNSRAWNRHGVKLAWALAGLCLLLVLASITWDAVSQSKVKSANYAKQNITPIRKRQTETYRVNTITGANLFGDASPAPVQQVVKKTTLNLKLQGILWATDEKIARAIITSGSKKSQFYSVGEEIKGSGASIQEIRSNEVVLDRNGAAESLELNKKYKSDPSLITYAKDGEFDRTSSVQSASLNVEQVQERAPQTRQNSQDSQPRKIRKPNFSGLDRALQKMGEI